MHETEVALLNEVEQGKTRSLVLLGDRDHQTKVGLHERTLGIFTIFDEVAQFALLGRRECLAFIYFRFFFSGLASFDLLGETNFVIFGEQCVLPDV